MENEEPIKELPVDMWLEKEEQHIGVQLACANCGSLAFTVLQGDYYTAVSCVTCKIPHGVHYG